MDGAIKRGSALMLVCLTALVVLLAAAGSATASQAQYDEAYRIGLAGVHLRAAAAQDGHHLPHHDEHRRVEGRLRAGQPVQQRAQAEQPGQHGRRRAGGQHALVHRVGRLEAGAAGPARAAGLEPLLRPRAARPVHDGPQEPGQRPRHPAGRLRPSGPRPARPAGPGRHAPHRRPVLAAVDHRVHPAAGASGTSRTSTASRTATRSRR